MKVFSRALIAGTALAVTVTFAGYASQEGREDLMKAQGAAVKVLADMAGGKTPFDVGAASAARDTLIADAAKIPEVFTDPATEAESEAKAEIWTNWDDFVKKAEALGAAATAMDVASAETIGAGMAAIGGACKDCHTTYRAMK